MTLPNHPKREPFVPFWFTSSSYPAGWYFTDDRGVWDGPHETRLDAKHYIEETKKEFPRS